MGFLSTAKGAHTAALKPYAQPGSLGLQAKMEVSKADDAAEKEADAIARQVTEEQTDKKAATKAEPEEAAQPDALQAKEEAAKEDMPLQKESVVDEEKAVHKKEDTPDKEQALQKQEETAEHEKPLQKQAAENEQEKPVQAKNIKEEPAAAATKKIARKQAPGMVRGSRPAGPVQRKAAPAAEQIKEKPAEATRAPQQAHEAEAGDAANDDAALAAIEQRIDARRGQGMALPPDLLQEMNTSFGYNFEAVRLHTDTEAHDLCVQLQAQAFAVGNDIFFRQGKYNPETKQGRELLSHELTHVVQQRNHIHRKSVMRTGGGAAPAAGGAAAATTGTVDEASKTITITAPHLSLPQIKGEAHRAAKYPAKVRTKKNYNRDDATAGTASQTTLWENEVLADVAGKIEDMTNAVAAKPQNPAQPDMYYFKWGQINLFGTKQSLKENSKRPLWNQQGNVSAYDVDHILELQLEGGENAVDNLELLNFSANRGSGSVISSTINQQVSAFLRTTEGQATGKATAAAAMAEYTIEFNSRQFDRVSGTTAKGADFWQFDDVKTGKHLQNFTPMTTPEVEALVGVNMEPTAFTSPVGGASLTAASARMPGFNANINLNRADTSTATDSEQVGTLSGNLSINDRILRPMNMSIPLYGMPGVAKGGYIARREPGKQSLESVLRRLSFIGLSPVTITTCDILPGVGIVASGRIEPTVEIIEGLYIDFTIEGDKVTLSRTFTASDIKGIPPPLKVTEASLRVFAEGGANTALGINGNINFEITNVGTGVISASANSNGVFRLQGNFDFDPRLFGGVRASVAASYQHTEGQPDEWQVEGDVRIPRGKIPGVSQANIHVSYQDRTFQANGNAQFDIPGLQDGNLSVTYANDQLDITGEANFNHRLIRSGQARARVQLVGDETRLSLSGTARPNIPGVDTELSVSYEEGAITITGSVAYNRGRLSGSITAGVTNRTVGADGQPTGAPGNSLIAFGSGTLTLNITPWLQGSATVTLLPDGNIEVVGRIGIPDTVDIFPRKEIEKQLFRAPTLEIPLFAIPVGPRSVGLVATISGGAQAYAGIGPGQLTQAEVEVRYNPAREEDMSVTGRATFRVPADAGIRLSIRAGIGLSVGIARVGGGIEIGGALGIEGAAQAAVEVNWTPTSGFVLDAEASLEVQPKFKFDVSAYLEAVLDLWITEFRAEYRKQLYAFEWGPSMTFGVRFPVHYAENEPFDISLDQVEFTAPDINVAEFARGIGQQLF